MKSSRVLFFFCILLCAFHARTQSLLSNDLILGFEGMSDMELKNIATQILQIPGTQIVGISLRSHLILIKGEDTMTDSKANIIDQFKVLHHLPADFTFENNLPLRER